MQQYSDPLPDESEQDVVVKPRFKRMKPRVGVQYQTKVAKCPLGLATEYTSTRPIPHPLSSRYAHLTMREIQDFQKGSMIDCKKEPRDNMNIDNESVGISPLHGKRTRVGGTCVHRSSMHNCTPAQLLPVIGETVMEQAQSLSREAFCQEMISRYGSSNNARGRKKRNATTAPADEWTSCSTLAQQRHESKLFLYDEETRLNHLQTVFGGNEVAAELNMRIRLSNGTARKARRILLKTLHSSRFKRPSQLSSASWREPLQLTLGMWGDLRTQQSTQIDTQYLKAPITPMYDDDDMKGVWRSILSYGQSMERAAANGTRPSFTEVVNFMRSASSLPLPEASFGNRHVCVEQISDCFHNLLDHVCRARDARAGILDFLADDEGGIDVDTLCKILDDQIPKLCPLLLPEESVLRKELQNSVEWQCKVDALLENPPPEQDCLVIAQELAAQARLFGVTTCGLVLLEKRIDKAHQLQERLEGWDQEGCKSNLNNTVKSFYALVREVNRVNLPSLYVRRLLDFNKELESWVERSNIAIRSRISLSEVESLIHRAETMPLNLSEYLDKLHARVRLAKAWIAQVERHVPCVYTSDSGGSPTVDLLGWMKAMRLALAEDQSKRGKGSLLLDLCSEGSRIPVEITVMKMLQLEIDAKNWMQKAEKWSPRMTDSRKGKIEDLREHLEKAKALRDRLPFEDKDQWLLDYEHDIESIVNAAYTWFQEFQVYVDWDNRRNNAQECLSLDKLRRIVMEGTAIHANVGNAVTKMVRILSQADAWFTKNYSLLVRAGVQRVDGNLCIGKVSLLEVMTAVSDASSDISIDLQEAISLQEVADKIQCWIERTGNAAPIKRSKRVGKGRWSCKAIRFRESDLVNLIGEAESLPIPTDGEVLRLRRLLEEVYSWRKKAHSDLREIATSFQLLGASMHTTLGPPHDVHVLRLIGNATHSLIEQEVVPLEVEATSDAAIMNPSVTSVWVADSISLDSLPTTGSKLSNSPDDSATNNDDGVSRTEVSSSGDSDSVAESTIGCSGGAEAMIASLLAEARQTGVMTAEEELVASLEKIAKWCTKSLKALEFPSELYETRNFARLEQLIQSGSKLLEVPEKVDEGVIDRELAHSLRSGWSKVVKEQLCRLEKLREHRDTFVVWSKASQAVLSAKDKKLTIEALNELSEQSQQYPHSTEIVQKIRKLALRVLSWKEQVNNRINSTDSKMSLPEAKALLEEGDKLKLVCNELKVLRSAIRAARMWLSKVKKAKVEHGGTAAADIESLIEDHDCLVITMSEEVEKLKLATKGFCLCRRPYEGFMIGCDSCDEWYHGPCIGITESQAARYDKYVCVRCCVKRVFEMSVNTVASTLKKWTSIKDKKKARQAEYQKHQRKVRKETKDIEKYEEKIDEYRHQLSSQRRERKTVTDDVNMLDCGQPTAFTIVDGSSGEISITAHEESLALQMANNLVVQSRADRCASCLLLDKSDFKGAVLSTIATFRDEGDVNKSSRKVSGGCWVNSIGSTSSNQEMIMEMCERESNTSNCDPVADENRSLVPSGEVIQHKINKLQQSIESCKHRLEDLRQVAKERFEFDRQEDQYSGLFKIWCIRVRSHLLVPSSQNGADRCRPSPNGTLSPFMLDLLKDAETLGIAKFQDVHLVAAAFQSICWSSLAMTTLAKRSSLTDIQHVLASSSAIALADEKAVKLLKSMIQRTTYWQIKVRKALAPKPGESRPFSMDVLNNLDSESSGLPFETPELLWLVNAIDDKGRRHCCCGGANDGTFMLGCDKCDEWFHGRCVGVSKEYGSQLGNWLCPRCKGERNDDDAVNVVEFEPNGIEDEDSSESQEWASCAPTMEKLWPPFKLLGSTESREALGDECIMIPDAFGCLGHEEIEARTMQTRDSSTVRAHGVVDHLVRDDCSPILLNDNTVSLDIQRTELVDPSISFSVPAIVADDHHMIDSETQG